MEEEILIEAMVLKVASRCNIDCTYCYMYHKGDTSYAHQPKAMSREVLLGLIPKVRLHCFLTGQTQFVFCFHGGEPLLAGKDLLAEFMREVEKAFVPDIVPKFFIQTNGTLIDDEWCELFAKHKVKVGISLDGPKEINDKNRLTFSGKSTFDDVVAGIRKIQRSPACANAAVDPAILTVIDIESNPAGIYNLIKDLGVKSFTPIIPGANHQSLPPGLAERKLSEWLIELFNLWFYDTSPQKPKIAFFKNIMRLFLGIKVSNEYIGNENLGLVVLETNGELEPSDELKICGESFTKTGKNILHHDFDDLRENDLMMAYYRSKNKLCAQCDGCAIKDICGGGFMPHRFSDINGFDNPSVYCNDLARLIVHIQNTIHDMLPADFTTEEKYAKLNFDFVAQSWESKVNT